MSRGELNTLVKTVFKEFFQERSLFHGAALGYYALLSMVPILYLSVSIVGHIVGHDVMLEVIAGFFQQEIGIKDTTELISFLDQIDLSKGNIWLEIGGLFALMLSTTAMLNSLRRSLNDFYDLEKWQVSRKRRIVRGVMFRMMSVGVVTGSVLIFIVVYFLETVFLSMGGGLFSEHTWYGSFFSYVARHGLPLVTDIFLFAFIFMYINDGKVRWRRAFEGALVTGILMYLGQLLIHLYIQNFFFAAKGGMIAGVLLVVLVWVYYSSQIIFLGAKFIAVRSRMLGHEVRLRD